MTTAERSLSYETVRHMDAWLAINLCEGSLTLFERIREDMMRLVASDQTYWLNQGWWKVFDRVTP